MSLKSRLLKNRELKSLNFAKMSADCDLLTFFREHKEFDTITAYSHDKIFGEKNGNIVKIPIIFSNQDSYIAEVEKIAKLYDFYLDKKNPQVTISTPSNSIINILMPPIVEKEPFIRILRKNKQEYTSYFSSKIISSEMVAYLRDCLSQKANIFIIGDASVDKTSLMNFLVNLSDNNKKNIICGRTEKIIVEKPCSIKLSQGSIKDIENLNYDNIFYSDALTTDLTQIFQLIISGHNGFVVSMSLKENVDILTAIRNMLLLSNINLFEENADFMTANSIDVVISVNKTDNDFSVTKISEIVKISQNDYSIKDIFVKNSNGYHYSTGNSSRFFNPEKSQRFMSEFLEEGHKHSYISGENTSAISPIQQTKSKRKKLKEKLKRLKKERTFVLNSENTIITKEKIEKDIQENQIISETEKQQEKSFEFFGKTINEDNEFLDTKIQTTEDVITNIDKSFDTDSKSTQPSFQDVLENSSKETVLENDFDDFAKEISAKIPKNKIKNILDLDDEENTLQEDVDTTQEVVDNYDEDADITTLLSNEELSDIEEELKNKYKDEEQKIIEEPQLFSEITENEIKEYEQGIIEVPDEDI